MLNEVREFLTNRREMGLDKKMQIGTKIKQIGADK